MNGHKKEIRNGNSTRGTSGQKTIGSFMQEVEHLSIVIDRSNLLLDRFERFVAISLVDAEDIRSDKTYIQISVARVIVMDLEKRLNKITKVLENKRTSSLEHANKTLGQPICIPEPYESGIKTTSFGLLECTELLENLFFNLERCFQSYKTQLPQRPQLN